MKQFSLILPALAILLIGGGCSQEPIATIDLETTSAKKVYESTVRDLAETSYSDAVLVGYNNQGLSFDRINQKPLETDTSGVMPYWTFVFAKSNDVLADNILSDNETFAIEFVQGDLFLSEGVVTRDYSLNEDSWMGEETLLATDSDTLIANFLESLEHQVGEEIVVEHININAKPGIYEITIFSPNNLGYEAHIDPRTGEIIYWNAIEFISF